jgi:peptide/nickel transport system ATP-binding protein
VRCVRAPDLVDNATGSATARALQRVPAVHPVLSVEGVRASYGDRPVLHGVDLGVLEGECLAVVGESGSGKTTLARCLVGLHQRWEGSISWRGAALPNSLRNRSREQLRAIQYVFQNPYASLNPRRPVSKIIGQPVAQFYDVASRERQQRVIAALEAAALSADFLNLRPGQLSGGERQRVAIARALAVRPDVLVCDEVTSSLDVSVQATIVEMLRSLQADQGLTVIFITHNLALVRSIAHRVAVMHDGVLVEIGETQDVLDRPQADHTRQLLADLPGLSAAAPGLRATGTPVREQDALEGPTHSTA